MPPSREAPIATGGEMESGPRVRPGLRSLAVLIAVPTAALCLSYSRDFLSHDGAQHLSVARNLLGGHGLATSIVYYDEHYRIGGVPVPQTVFPPGFPIAVAALAWAGLPLHLSAFVLGLAALNLGTLLTVATFRGAGQSSGPALLAGLVWAGSVVEAENALECGGDLLFVAATLASLVFVQRLPDKGPVGALLAGALAAAGFWIRYAGVFFILSLGLVLVGRLVRSRTRRSLVDLGLGLLLPATSLLFLFGRNYRLAGDFKGGNAYEVARPVADVARLFFRGATGLVGFSPSGFLGARPAEVLLGVGLVLLAWLWFASRPTWAKGELRRRLSKPGTALSFVYVSVSLALLWYLERTRELGVSARMLLPLVPFALLLAAELLAGVRFATPRLSQKAALGGLGGLYLLGQATLLPPQAALETAARARAVRAALGRSAEIERLLADDRSGARPIVVNEAQLVGDLLAQPVLGLTQPAYTATRWTDERVLNVVRRYGVRHVVFLTQVFASADEGEKANQDFFLALARGEVPSWLVRIRKEPDIEVFELR